MPKRNLLKTMVNNALPFRGKTYTGVWVYGSYLKVPPYMPCVFGDKEKFDKDTKHLIISLKAPDWGFPYTREESEVLPNTVTLCTGLCAKNCYNYTNYIYEGDILKHNEESGIVFWNKDLARFSVKLDDGETIPFHKKWANNCEIVGNIYEES